MKIAFASLAAIFFISTASDAATRSIQFTRSLFMVSYGSARVYPDQSIQLPSTGSSEVSLSFVLPQDFLLNSNASLDVYFEGPPNCSYQLNASYFYRDRLGSESSGSSDSAKSGYSATVAGPTLAPTSGSYRMFKKSFNLKKPSGLKVTGQRAGDIVTAYVMRVGDALTDTCGPGYVVGGKLIYKTP